MLNVLLVYKYHIGAKPIRLPLVYLLLSCQSRRNSRLLQSCQVCDMKYEQLLSNSPETLIKKDPDVQQFSGCQVCDW